VIKILHIIDHLGLGGAQSALLDLVVNRDPAETGVEVAVLHGEGLFARQLREAGIKVHSLAPSKWPPVYLPRLVKLARGGDYDIIHFHLQGSNWLAKPLCAASVRARRVAHEHGSADLRFRGWWSLLPEGVAHLFSDRVVAVSDGVADFLAAKEFVPRRKITMVPNGVDTEVFRLATPEEKMRARRALGLPESAFIAGGLGRLAPEKNFRALIDVARRCPDLVFAVGGSGPEEGALRAAAVGLGNFQLLGPVEDRAAFHAALDVFVLTSQHEALPMTLLEAMASGVPVVASDLEGVAAALGDTGMLVPPGDVSELVRSVAKLAADPEARGRFGGSALARVREKYSARVAARRMANLYRELLAD